MGDNEKAVLEEDVVGLEDQETHRDRRNCCTQEEEDGEDLHVAKLAPPTPEAEKRLCCSTEMHIMNTICSGLRQEVPFGQKLHNSFSKRRAIYCNWHNCFGRDSCE